jgi:hypothetical protein
MGKDDYNLLYLTNQSSHNNEIETHAETLKAAHHKSCDKYIGNVELLPMCAVLLLHQLLQLHLRFIPVTLLGTVSLIVILDNTSRQEVW